ncbi:processed acidic surface protein [Neobacillus bataviensis]|uniref:Processed acidic surface protein n=1 Tax=Neobacillus bataviensis TaxID=220685 RepID=A0A561CGV0_9BACI|nr:processed acidic surface protein [Neobacillus bataviensis]TWD90207.1 processed acidic surface protein [Neobacillus bataviensis]
MVRIRVLLVLMLTLPFLLNVPSANAAPSETELNQYLAEIGWTKQELLDYLSYYEIPLDDFNTVEDLKDVMGTPINSQNFQELLTKYGLTEKEFNDLMDHFGDNVNDYKFIEDLDASVAFYVNYDEYMAETEKALGEFGITEEEAERFFNYLAEVEEKNKDQLDQIATNDTLWEKFLNVEDPSQLSDEDLNEMVQILEQTIALYEIKMSFKVNGQPVTLKDLLKMEEPPKGNLSGSIFSSSGELLIDFNIPQEFFESLDVVDNGEDLLHLGEISDDYVDHMHDKKYEQGRKNLK